MGMSGAREMLKALKKTHSPPPLPTSSASASSESSINNQNQYYYPHHIQPQRHCRRTSTESTQNRHQDPTSLYNDPALLRIDHHLCQSFGSGRRGKLRLLDLIRHWIVLRNTNRKENIAKRTSIKYQTRRMQHNWKTAREHCLPIWPLMILKHSWPGRNNKNIVNEHMNIHKRTRKSYHMHQRA